MSVIINGILITERPKQSAELDYKEPRTSTEYACFGSLLRTDILLAIAQASPAYDVAIDAQTAAPIPLYRNKVDCKEEGGGAWTVTVHYDSSPDTIDLAFTFGVQNQKIYQSLETVTAYNCIDPAGPAPPDFERAIGVNGDDVEGVEIEVGRVEFSVTKKWRRASMPVTYFQVLADLTDRSSVNDATFVFIWLNQTLTFPKGSLRFRCAPVKWKSNDEIEISYQFAYQRALTTADDFSIGNSENILKEGWMYLWVRYESTTNAGAAVKKPTAAYVERVYPYKDLNLLQL